MMPVPRIQAVAEEKLRLASLTVLGGPLHGRRHDPEEVVGEILIGSDPDCHLALDHPDISPIHARVWADLDQSIVYDTHAPRGLYVNTTRVLGQAPIGEGDVLWLGPPQEEGSVCVQCRFEPWVEVLPPSPVAEGPVEAAPAGAPPVEAYEAVVLEEPAPAPAPGGLPDAADAAATLEVTPSVAAEAKAPLEGARTEDDPFFVGEEPAGEAEAPPVAPPAGKTLPTVAPDLSPEALIAETIADDWAIADSVPSAPAAGPQAPAPAPADDFFVAEDSAAPGAPAAPLVAPAIDLPPLEPPLEQHPSSRAPLPPKLATPPPAVPAPPPPAVSPAPKQAAPSVSPAPAEPRPAAPRPRAGPAPAAVRRPAVSGALRPASARRPGVSSRPARRPARGRSGSLRPIGLAAAGLAVLAAIGFGALRFLGGSVQLAAVEPSRLRVGQRATLTGSGFASDLPGNTVLFDDRQARVLQASPTRLEVEVPEAVSESGAERQVGVVVKRGGRASATVTVAVFQGPRLHGISPDAAMPGEEVLLAGAGWGLGATVRFGDVPAQINEIQPTRIRAVVPAIAGGPGTEAPVVVSVGGIESNAAPFLVGHLPVVSAVSPADVAPGDVVEVSGRGFQADPLRNDVRVGGVPALVLAAAPDALKVVIPRVSPGEPSRVLEVRVPGSESVGQAALQVASPADPVEFHFAAGLFPAASARPLAVLSTGLGPAFVLSASAGRTAAERAVEAAERLNAAGQALRTTVGLNLEARGLDSSPVLALAGRPDVLLDVAEEDAAAYNEDWTALRGRGGPVTRARLARWWEALGRDIVLLTVRGERPHFAADLAPEGRVLAQLFEAAQRSGRPGVPRQVVDDARPPVRDALRLLALRVPPSVAAPAAAPASATPPSGAPTPAPVRLQLEGTWGGSQVEEGQRQYFTVSFQRGGGTISYEGGITFTMPLATLEQPRRDQVAFSVQIRGGTRYYAARWDGEALAGSVSTDAAGRNVVATFVLHRR
jgi:hypothetical protein